MHLKTVTLNNFRCFERLELPLHPRLTVIVADNGGGKTALLDGIAIGLSPVLRYFSSANQRLSGPGIEDNDFRLEVTEGRSGDERWVASDFSQIAVETTTGLRWDNWRGASTHKQPEVKIGQAELANYSARVLDSLRTRNPELLPVFAYYGARRGWIVIPDRLRESKANKVDYTQPTSALVGSLESLSDFKEMLKWFDLEEASELRANKLSPGELFEDYETSPSLSAIRSVISNLLGKEYTNPHFNKRHKFVVECKSGPGVLQVSQLSQGYQSMLALGMDFARRLSLANSHMQDLENDAALHHQIIEYIQRWQNPGDELSEAGPLWAPAVMIVDEIDLHLHPSWQQRVLPDLMRAFPGTQFIVTTHSPQVLSTVKKECIRMLKQDTNGLWIAPSPDEETKGTESSVAMNDVMGVDQIPPVLEAKWRNEYTALIENGLHQTQAGLELKANLINHFGAQHPIMLDFDRLIRFQAFKRKQGDRPN